MPQIIQYRRRVERDSKIYETVYISKPPGITTIDKPRLIKKDAPPVERPSFESQLWRIRIQNTERKFAA
jgi:hypothetical protein